MMAADLEVNGVSWAPTKSGQPVLHPTTFSVAAERVLGVVGPNGAGKSTLLRLLYRFQQPKTGHVRVDGQDIWSMSARDAARRIAAVLQEQASAFGLTVREIVRLGRTPHRSGFAASGAGDEKVVERVLDTLSLHPLAHRDFGTLSGGERQRVMVARALAQEPQVLILDEPTNHLDVRHQLEVVSLIRSLGLTIVVSLHDLNVAAGVCDDVLVLKDGHSQGFGPPQTLLTNALVSNTFRVDARREHLAPSGASHFSFTLPN
ncbi:ABC transporter ATP-binding protein [Tritonibacter horizontis]|uniref:Iron(3+)-hydroxamate import ATP-binding protein FhuC n=1 Tax=Tritonibacter horizontis TaxID=1768241 RepID=A0A132BS57_9RHOB|nr:ABC transporter ATP-binding protein [Tritonibacter horizontis]KUP91144.1 iron(3+)-hydroxamate import ATP-binding protein FhuC [Tritonibacter horizontis]